MKDTCLKCLCWKDSKQDSGETMIRVKFLLSFSFFTVLKKRPAFRLAFDNFDSKKIAKYGPAKKEELLANTGIIRHRGKIDASKIHSLNFIISPFITIAINNAALILKIQKEFGSFHNYILSFMPNNKPILQTRIQPGQAPPATSVGKSTWVVE
jgi:DNA-3-methyladenine glycosylase I